MMPFSRPHRAAHEKTHARDAPRSGHARGNGPFPQSPAEGSGIPLSPVLSVVIPVYNAASLLDGLHENISRALKGVGGYEIIFVDDGSRDESLAHLHAAAGRDARVTVVSTGRNTGQQEATLYGLSLASGRYCATLDDDGQHPPDLLPAMLEKLVRENLDIVYAVPLGHRETFVRTLGRVMRDRMFSLLFPHCGKMRVSSYRVMTQRLARRVLAGRRAFNYFSALVFQKPTRAATVAYPFRPNPLARSGYTFPNLLHLYWKIFRHYGPFAAKRPPAPGASAAWETRERG